MADTEQTEKIGIMGGTFDPIHIGHLATASEDMSRWGLDRIIFIPTGTPIHKPKRKVEDAGHRYNMVQEATRSNPKFSVSRIDIDRGIPTKTIDTLEELHNRLPTSEIYFITGADSINDLPNWHGAKRLLELATFIAVSRDGHAINYKNWNGLDPEKVIECPMPSIAMSSTEIRRRIENDEPVWYWIPEPVLFYIGKHNLYGADWNY